MKQVKGGVAAYNYECQCSAVAGETSAVWYGSYTDDMAASVAVENYCPHGGGCRAGSYAEAV